jgi:hypothetical protein
MIPTLSSDITDTGQRSMSFGLGSMTFPSAGGRFFLDQGHIFQNSQLLSDFAQIPHANIQYINNRSETWT